MKPWVPHKYQERGVRVLTTQLDGGAGLGLDPGMGKTTISLGAFEVLRTAGLAKKMLVIAPVMPMYDTWPHEPKKWSEFFHLRVGVLHGSRKNKVIQEEHDVYVINPEGLPWLVNNHASFLNEVDVLCVDESTKFKNATSKRFKLLKKNVLPKVQYRWILTGTIVPNGLEDLFGQVYIMDLGESLGKYITQYRNNYFYPSGYGGYKYTPHDGAHEQIAMLVGPRLLSLSAEDYLDMPELMVIEREVTLDKKSMELYKELEAEFIDVYNGETIVAANAAAAGTKCRQIANGAVYTTRERDWTLVHNKKLEALESVMEETNGLPLLIVYEYGHDRERIMKFLGKDAACLTGVRGSKLKELTDRFNHGSLQYLVVHAGSVHGLNIQGACYHMVWFCIPWDLEAYIQTVWRLYRQGQQSKTVFCYHLIAKGTLDVKVSKVLDHKKSEQNQLHKLLGDYANEQSNEHKQQSHVRPGGT